MGRNKEGSSGGEAVVTNERLICIYRCGNCSKEIVNLVTKGRVPAYCMNCRKNDALKELFVKMPEIQKTNLFRWLNRWADLEKHYEASKAGKITEWGHGYKQAVSDVIERLEKEKVKA